MHKYSRVFCVLARAKHYAQRAGQCEHAVFQPGAAYVIDRPKFGFGGKLFTRKPVCVHKRNRFPAGGRAVGFAYGSAPIYIAKTV